MNRLFSNKKINKVREDINGYCSTCDIACASSCAGSCKSTCSSCYGYCNNTCASSCGLTNWSR